MGWPANLFFLDHHECIRGEYLKDPFLLLTDFCPIVRLSR
ncbi:Uncharacterised protein [Vibrio cholerae]|nr:Uncharacterised protein [Vibrio cholerae]